MNALKLYSFIKTFLRVCTVAVYVHYLKFAASVCTQLGECPNTTHSFTRKVARTLYPSKWPVRSM